MTIRELVEFVKELGFDGVEFPLRDGYQVEPSNAVEKLPVLAEEMKKQGLSIMSVASHLDESIFKACSESGVTILRIMLSTDTGESYMEAENKWQKMLNNYVPLCRKYNVKIGIQQHFGPGVFNTMELRHLLEKCDTEYIRAIWDAAHSGLAGEEPEQALDIIWDHLELVNLKNAYYKRELDPATNKPLFTPFFTLGHDGIYDWKRAADYLIKRGYKGDICMPAEYTDEENVVDYIKTDLAYVKKLFNS